jgi:hypothetical protein
MELENSVRRFQQLAGGFIAIQTLLLVPVMVFAIMAGLAIEGGAPTNFDALFLAILLSPFVWLWGKATPLVWRGQIWRSDLGLSSIIIDVVAVTLVLITNALWVFLILYWELSLGMELSPGLIVFVLPALIVVTGCLFAFGHSVIKGSGSQSEKLHA